MTRVTGITIAVTNAEAMFRFYTEVFGAKLEPKSFGDFTMYAGMLGELRLTLCPRELAGISAEQNRHQLSIAIDDVREAYNRALAGGGSSINAPMQRGVVCSAAIRDPDGNSIEITGRISAAS